MFSGLLVFRTKVMNVELSASETKPSILENSSMLSKYFPKKMKENFNNPPIRDEDFFFTKILQILPNLIKRNLLCHISPFFLLKEFWEKFYDFQLSFQLALSCVPKHFPKIPFSHILKLILTYDNNTIIIN